MKRTMFLAVVAVSAVLPRVSGATDPGVAIYNNSFSPTPAQATMGERVTWTWTCSDGGYGGGTTCIPHNVTAFEGASFASGNKTAQASTFSFTLVSSGAIRYRCTNHSSLSGTACNGMCGAIVPDNTAPTIRVFRPASPLAAVGTPAAHVVFAGDVKDNRATQSMWLRVVPAVGSSSNVPVSCACPLSGQQVWQQAVTFDLGLYTVTAYARDTTGLEGHSDAITVLVV